MNKKILLISNNGQGFYNFKRELVEKLLEQGFEVYFSVPKYEKLIELEKKGAQYRELIIDRRGMNPIRDVGLIRKLYNIIKNVKPHIVVLHTIKPNIYGSFLCKLSGTPYINNITGLGSALQGERKIAKLLRSMYRFTLNKSSGIFFENQGNCSYFKKYKIGEVSKHFVVNGAGVNINFFKPNGYVLETNMPSEKKQDSITFLYIARLMKEKGIEEFLEAAKVIKERYIGVNFQILGYYDEELYREQVEDLVEKSIIKYLGTSNDTRKEMSKCDCIVLPSYHEGMSNVLLEGASFGLPLITTNINGCQEAVIDGVTGFLCEPRNSESLIQSMEKFISLSKEERFEMGRMGREKMIEEFDRDLVINKYLKVIEVILK